MRVPFCIREEVLTQVIERIIERLVGIASRVDRHQSNVPQVRVPGTAKNVKRKIRCTWIKATDTQYQNHKHHAHKTELA